MKKLIIILFFVSCSQYEDITKDINGTFKTEGLELCFKYGVLFAQTDYNRIEGQYYIYGDSIKIRIGWKKSEEFNITILTHARTYNITKNKLILRGEDLELTLYKL